MKLQFIHPANDGKHKYVATFLTDKGRTKTTRFGATGMDDYLHTHSKEQRERYRTRHAKDLNTGDPTRAGFLSYYLLWGDSTNLQTNINAYKKRFSL
jgi:hypothetical protein